LLPRQSASSLTNVQLANA